MVKNMKVLFVCPEAKGGITAYGKNVIKVLKSFYSDIEITFFPYNELKFNKLNEYIVENDLIINKFKNNNFDLIHIEFDFGYYGFKYGGLGAVDLINKLIYTNIPYTISIHNESEIFEEGMTVLGITTKPFSKIIDLINNLNYSNRIVHNPKVKGFYAPLLPLDLKQKISHNQKLHLKKILTIGLIGYIHRAKGYHDFLKFVVENNNLFERKRIRVECLFLKRVDRKSKDRLEYELELRLLASKSKHITLRIIPVNPKAYLDFINKIDVGLVSLRTMTQSGTITELIAKDKIVVSKKHKNLDYLDFIIQYDENTLYNTIANLRDHIKKYNYKKQEAYISITNSFAVAFAYRNCFLKNIIYNKS
jgi:hypothetical protein